MRYTLQLLENLQDSRIPVKMEQLPVDFQQAMQLDYEEGVQQIVDDMKSMQLLRPVTETIRTTQFLVDAFLFWTIGKDFEDTY